MCQGKKEGRGEDSGDGQNGWADQNKSLWLLPRKRMRKALRKERRSLRDIGIA